MTLFAPTDSAWLIALMVAGTTLSISLERRFLWAARLSGPVIALLLAIALSNLRLVPAEAPAYDFVSTWLLPLALPLLLLRADLRRIARETGRLLIPFHIAALGSVLGAWIAGALLRDAIPEASKAAGIMAASYIGGMVNFLAVQESTGASSSMTTALIVSDNLVMAASFLAILWVVASPAFLRRYPHPHTHSATQAATAASSPHAATSGPGLSVLDVGLCLSLATAVVALALAAKSGIESAWVASAADPWWWGVGRAMATNRFVLITALALAVATAFPRWLSTIRGADEIGSFILYLFLFGIGLPADLSAVVRGGPALFLLCVIICATNIGVTLALGRWLRWPLEELVLSVNATLGGPPTAAAMAVSKGWSRLVLPGILIGLWGYTIGTPLGLLVTATLDRWFAQP